MRSIAPLATGCICLAAALLFSHCNKNRDRAHLESYTYSVFTPVVEKRSDIIRLMNGNPNEPIDSAGKIYVDGHYIFVNEIDKGIHVIDNTTPSNPVQIAFIRIPGNRDMVIRSGILYADMYSELLSVDIHDLHHVFVTSEETGVFAERSFFDAQLDTTGLVVGVNAKDTTITRMVYPGSTLIAPNAIYSYSNASQGSATAGKSGSMARMVLIDDHIYAITERHTLTVFKLTDPGKLTTITNMNAGFDLETIYPFGDKLFLGSEIGVYMFDVTDKDHPEKLGAFTHGRACDPVIAENNIAYVTLHTGTACGGDANELDVVDITDIMNPSLKRSYSMTSPKGLSKDGNLLFVCDGNAVRIFDAAAPEKIKEVATLQCADAYDIITGQNTAIVVAKRGIHQYDYSDRSHIRDLSVISTNNR